MAHPFSASREDNIFALSFLFALQFLKHVVHVLAEVILFGLVGVLAACNGVHAGLDLVGACGKLVYTDTGSVLDGVDYCGVASGLKDLGAARGALRTTLAGIFNVCAEDVVGNV